MKRIIQFCFSLLLCLSALAQSTNRNYVVTRTYRYETDNTYRESIEYYDGLGRPVQQVERGAAPGGQDIVTHQEYDTEGRPSHSWLPAARAGNNGNFVTLANVKSAAWSVYADSAYIRPVYEASPLQRVLQEYGPGRAWQGSNNKAVKTEYLLNNSSNSDLTCRRYVAVTDDATGKITLSAPAGYANNTLYVHKVTDEDGNVSYEFTDKEERTLLTRRVNGTTRFDTYYVYDEYGNLAYVLPPLAADALTATTGSWNIDTNETLKQYAYAYRYDGRNRCVYKKLPGAEPVLMAYDKADRLILSQDGELKKRNLWAFAIPDFLGRTVLSGTATISSSDLNMLPSRIIRAEYGSNSVTLGYYTVSGITLTSSLTLLDVRFYDQHNFLSYPGFENLKYDSHSVELNTQGGKTKGYLTGGMTRQLTASGAGGWIYSSYFYDSQSRMIRDQSTNHLGGTDKEYIAYNHSDQPVYCKKIHTASGKATQIQEYTYVYDHYGRLSETFYKLNDNAQVRLALNTYDDVGRLIRVVRPQNSATMAYTYNVRSWLTGISSTGFQQTLYYNEAHTGSTPRYNGDISAIKWKSGNVEKAYNYTYDALSRLTKAQYYYNGASSTRNTLPAVTYDKHGNIKTIQRYGRTTATGSNYGVIDNLSIDYTGNQLKKVTESAGGSTYAKSREFKKYSTAATEYVFNANGALTKDLNKGISDISYNLVDLPAKVDIKNPQGEARNEYTYTADGMKLRVIRKWNPNFSTTPAIGSAVAVGSLTQSHTTDYVGDLIYENGTLKRINYEGGYYDPSTGRYYYYVTDHLGSVRLTVSNNAVSERTDYYPYGMPMAGEDSILEDKQPYKFSGKEEDGERGLNLHDFHARQYEAALGRFTTMDPLAEDFYPDSPYAYCLGNPVRLSDPTGMSAVDSVGVDLPVLQVVAPKREPVSGILGYASYIFTSGNYDGFRYNMDGEAIGLSPRIGFPPSVSKTPLISWKNMKEWGKSTRIKSVYKNVTKGNRKNKAKNIETDVTKAEFQRNLKNAGYQEEFREPGIINYFKNGQKKYTVRDWANSTQAPTADFYKNGSDKINMKIRLKK